MGLYSVLKILNIPINKVYFQEIKMTVLTDLFAQIKKRDPNQAPFHQAVEEVPKSGSVFGKKSEIYPTRFVGANCRT